MPAMRGNNHPDFNKRTEAPGRYPKIFLLFQGLDTIFEKEKQLQQEIKVDKDVSLKYPHLQ